MSRDEQDAKMRWLVGVDLHGRASGAIAFARWLAARVKGDDVIGVHVFGRALIDGADRSADTNQLRKLFDDALTPLRGDGCFSDLRLLPASTVVEGLTSAAKEKNVDALVVGRRKRTDRMAVSRLGREARRLLRTLPRPVVVVPPDLEQEQIGDGPVVVATECGDGSAGAARFARRIADRLKLPIHVVHVVPIPSDYRAVMPPAQLRSLVDRFSEGANDDLERWASEHGLSDARRRLAIGSIEGEILQIVETSHASMLVVGARGRGTLERLFVPSVATELAAAAPAPVAVVPQDFGA